MAVDAAGLPGQSIRIGCGWVHTASGRRYSVIANARMQVSGVPWWLRWALKLYGVYDMQSVVVYQSDKDWFVWVRTTSGFLSKFSYEVPDGK